MGQRANIILADGQATPVDHTFAPTQDAKNGNSIFLDRSGGIAAGYPTMVINLREPDPAFTVRKDASRLFKSDVRIIVPTLETISNNSAGYTPAPSAAYACMGRLQMFMPERSTTQERKNLQAYMRNWLAHAVANSLYQDNEGIW